MAGAAAEQPRTGWPGKLNAGGSLAMVHCPRDSVPVIVNLPVEFIVDVPGATTIFRELLVENRARNAVNPAG